MRLDLFRHLWGLPGTPGELFPRIKAQGYVGVESPLPKADSEAAFRAALAEQGLAYIAQIGSGGHSDRAVSNHVAAFTRMAERAITFAPRQINCHSGCDSWGLDEATAFYREAIAVERGLGVLITHETHRGRFLFHPRHACALLDRLPELRLCADFSHFVVVCERLLDEHIDGLTAIAPAVRHIHARVGHEEGPQVPDPRDPRWAHQVAAHERWWDLVWDAQERAGHAASTLTPEFGPPPYLGEQPFTQTPLADLAEICLWQAERQRTRFAARHAAQQPAR